MAERVAQSCPLEAPTRSLERGSRLSSWQPGRPRACPQSRPPSPKLQSHTSKLSHTAEIKGTLSASTVYTAGRESPVCLYPWAGSAPGCSLVPKDVNRLPEIMWARRAPAPTEANVRGPFRTPQDLVGQIQVLKKGHQMYRRNRPPEARVGGDSTNNTQPAKEVRCAVETQNVLSHVARGASEGRWALRVW